MKHYIIVKFTQGVEVGELLEPIRELFSETLTIPGIHGLELRRCCVDRSNRYDLMIVLDMDKEALAAYDASEPHHRWKETYGDKIAAKAIFDCEDA